MRGREKGYFSILKSRKHNCKTVEYIVCAVHFTLEMKERRRSDHAMRRSLGKEHGETIAEQTSTLSFTINKLNYLTTNTELNCRYPLSIRERCARPTVSIFTLSVRSQSDEVFIDHRITTTFPSFNNSIT